MHISYPGLGNRPILETNWLVSLELRLNTICMCLDITNTADIAALVRRGRLKHSLLLCLNPRIVMDKFSVLKKMSMKNQKLNLLTRSRDISEKNAGYNLNWEMMLQR